MNGDDRFGVALTKCYFCQESNEIVINKRLTKHYADQVKEMHGTTISMNPCTKCEEFMKQGIILITIDEAKSGEGWNKPPEGQLPNPYRTGGWFVVREEAVKNIFPTELADWAIKHRWMFIEHEAAEVIGLFDVEPSEGEQDGTE